MPRFGRARSISCCRLASNLPPLLYAPSLSASGQEVRLSEDEARHARKVLRLKPGEQVVVLNGLGLQAEGTLEADGSVSGLHRLPDFNEPPHARVLALGFLHHPDRLEWALEKAVELGVTHILVLRTERCQPGTLKPDRAQRILVAAMKQCQRSRLPELRIDVPLSRVKVDFPNLTWWIAHEGFSPQEAKLQDVLGGMGVVVGPEGGFSPQEVSNMLAAGARPLSLGTRRLRAETAAVAALSLFLP